MLNYYKINPFERSILAKLKIIAHHTHHITKDTGVDQENTQKYDLVFVTGMSGAGKTLALKILAERGFKEIDNLPVNMMTDIINNDLSENIL